MLQEPEQQRKLQTAPKSAPSKAQASISERNRAAAMARWHVATPAAAAAAACHSCGRDVKGAAAATGDVLPFPLAPLKDQYQGPLKSDAAVSSRARLNQDVVRTSCCCDHSQQALNLVPTSCRPGSVRQLQCWQQEAQVARRPGAGPRDSELTDHTLCCTSWCAAAAPCLK
jgi:hypothetical protein